MSFTALLVEDRVRELLDDVFEEVDVDSSGIISQIESGTCLGRVFEDFGAE